MPLSPPTLTWHIALWVVSSAMSPFQAPAHGAGLSRPVGAPLTSNSLLWHVAPPHRPPPASGSEIQTLPLKPTPHGRTSPAGPRGGITPPGAVGDRRAGVRLT